MKRYIFSLMLFAVFANVHASQNSFHRTAYDDADLDMSNQRGKISLEHVVRACLTTKNSQQRLRKMAFYANEERRKSSQESYDTYGSK